MSREQKTVGQFANLQQSSSNGNRGNQGYHGNKGKSGSNGNPKIRSNITIEGSLGRR
jgi:hypothetical protein